MSAAILQPPVSEALPPRKRFTRSEVQQMLDAGLFAGQRFELIDGDLIDKMGQNPPHAYAIRVLLVWLAKILGAATVRVQLPIEVASADQEWTWPEPDLALLSDSKADYRRRHPRGDELLLVIEVADSTVQYDAGLKRDLYARAGVREYWVLDVGGRKLMVHRRPLEGHFQEVFTLSDHDTASPECYPDHSIPVAEMLP